MQRGWKFWVIVAAVAVAAFALLRVGRILRGSNAVTSLRDSVAVLRTAADSCRAELDAGQSRLRAYHDRLDTMRSRVRGFEALDPRGVPADSYRIYLQAFHLYNDSAAGWQARVDSLQTQLDSCRVVTDAHNTAADSLRALILRQR